MGFVTLDNYTIPACTEIGIRCLLSKLPIQTMYMKGERCETAVNIKSRDLHFLVSITKISLIRVINCSTKRAKTYILDSIQTCILII